MQQKLRKYWMSRGLESNQDSKRELAEKETLAFFSLNLLCVPHVLGFTISKYLDGGISVLVWFLSCYVIYVASLAALSFFNKKFRPRLRLFVLWGVPVAASGLTVNMILNGPGLADMLATIVTMGFITSVIRKPGEALFFLAFYTASTIVLAIRFPTPEVIHHYLPAIVTLQVFLGVAIYFRFQGESVQQEISEQSESLLSMWTNILDNANVVISMTDVSGVVVDISKTFVNEKSQMIGKNFIDFIPEEQRSVFTNALQRAAAGRKAENYLISLPVPAGHVATFSNSVWPLLERGKIIGFMYFTLDVTAQKVAEQKELHHTQVSILGELSASIAHEIRNPLAVITGNLDLIGMQVVRGVSALELMPRLEKIRVMSERIGSIVINVRRMYRPGDFEPVLNENVSEMVKDAVSFCSQKCMEKNIRVEVIQMNPDLKLVCRPVQISQAILNLMHNSVDAAQEFKEKWIRIVVQELGDDVKISVIDSGKGLAETVLANIGRSFYTTKKVGQGNGLGLSLAKRIVEGHGGEFNYDNSSAHTKFDLIIPKKIKINAAA